MIEIEIPYNPISAPRPRVARGRVYYDQRYDVWRAIVSHFGKLAMRGKPPLKGSLSVSLHFYKKITPTSKSFGDVDNLSKAVLDALNGICYEDDSQIVELYIEKNRADKPRCEIEIGQLVHCEIEMD